MTHPHRLSAFAPALALFACLAAGCSHNTEEVRSTNAVVQTSPEREVVAVDRPQFEAEPPRARPRLSQTLTLGQSNPDATYAGDRPPPPPQPAGPNVVVNNNVYVNGPPVVYGGYPGYGGYGGYGRSSGRESFGSRGTGTGQWGSNGFEGARRTAPPGQTPGIGGNWSPPPSYGPAPMR
jgi:hypothetical protein